MSPRAQALVTILLSASLGQFLVLEGNRQVKARLQDASQLDSAVSLPSVRQVEQYQSWYRVIKYLVLRWPFVRGAGSVGSRPAIGGVAGISKLLASGAAQYLTHPIDFGGIRSRKKQPDLRLDACCAGLKTNTREIVITELILRYLPPKASDFLIPNVSWLLDTAKDDMKNTILIYLRCLQTTIIER